MARQEFLPWLPHACLGFTRKAIALGGGRAVSVNEIARGEAGGTPAVTYTAAWS